jgi:hypothetical protein
MTAALSLISAALVFFLLLLACCVLVDRRDASAAAWGSSFIFIRVADREFDPCPLRSRSSVGTCWLRLDWCGDEPGVVLFGVIPDDLAVR